MPLQLTKLASLPTGLKNGVGGKLGSRLYAGLGSAGKRFFFLDLNTPDPQWEEAPEFPGVARNDAAFAVAGQKLWVFSGAGQNEGDSHATVLNEVWCFDSATGQWSQADTAPPVGFLGASACEVQPGRIALFGGYCKETFDSFVAEISAQEVSDDPQKRQAVLTEFMSRWPGEYGWSRDIWCLDTETLSWQLLRDNPFEPNCGAALIRDKHKVVLVEGEIKPGLRSLQTKQFTFHSLSDIEPSLLLPLCDAEPEHEGIAGGFAGMIDGDYLVAGGAYFIGSQARFREGKCYSHQGLTKHYSDRIWRCGEQGWQPAGSLPCSAAYGLSVSADNQIYILGGEDQQGNAFASCYVMK